MPTKIRKEFIAEGCVARVTKRPSGRGIYCYEIRYRRHGYNVAASSTDPDEAKAKFIKALNLALASSPVKNSEDRMFKIIADEFLECRKPYLIESTYKGYKGKLRTNINPIIGDKDITKIRSADLVPIMHQPGVTERVYEDIRSVLNQVFKYAMVNGIIPTNPVALIEFKRAERESGVALAKEQIITFFERIEDPTLAKFKPGLLLEFFFGLRPCEVKDMRLDGDFLVTRNRKRKSGRIEYKRIPIPDEAKKYDLTPITTSTARLNDGFRLIFPSNTQYDLRHTFSSKCQEFVRQEIVEVWLGDSPEKIIGKTYTHYADEFMLSEMKKVHFVPQNVPQNCSDLEKPK